MKTQRFISVLHDTTVKYWDNIEDFFTTELKAYVNDCGQIVIPAPYYSEDKKDFICNPSYNMDEFTKEEAMRDFAINYGRKLVSRYFYKLHTTNN